MAVALRKEGFSIGVIIKIIGCHQSAFHRMIKMKLVAGHAERIT